MSASDKHSDFNLDLLFYYAVVDRLAHLGKSSMLMSTIIALLVCAALWEQAEKPVLLIWIGIILGCVAIRAALIMSFWRMNINDSCLRSWIRKYVFFICLSAACWGFLPFFEAFRTTDWTKSFLIFVAAGMSSGGLASLYPLLYASIPYILIIMIPLMIVLAGGPEPSVIIMGVMAALYTIMLVRSTFVLNRSSNQAIRQEIENKELFKFLKRTRSEQLGDFEKEGSHEGSHEGSQAK